MGKSYFHYCLGLSKVGACGIPRIMYETHYVSWFTIDRHFHPFITMYPHILIYELYMRVFFIYLRICLYTILLNKSVSTDKY